MDKSAGVVDGLRNFYEQFCTHDAESFASAIADSPAVSVIGSAPGEGHDSREDWIATYAEFIPTAGMRLEGGPEPHGWQEGTIGFALDEPRFVLPDGSYLPTRLSGVLRLEGDDWKVVHLHFSVGVRDEDAVQAPA